MVESHMSSSKDLYELLSVPRTASADEIRKAYRKLARKYHPDVNTTDKHNEERFKEMTAAYDVLSDPKKRKLYDEFGEAGLREGFDADKARAYAQWGGVGGGAGFTGGEYASAEGFDFNIGDIFGDFFRGGGRGGRGRAQPMKGRDISTTIDIDFTQALFGAEVKFQLAGQPGSTPETISVRIPPGADNGSKLRVQGRGQPGFGGGPAGDLVIETRVRPHPFFKRNGLDLTLKLPVTLSEAYNGATLEIPTPEGSVNLRIPKNSQQGTHLRVKGKGVHRGSKHGDLFVELDIRLPEQHDEELAECLQKASALYSGDLRSHIRLA